MMFTEHILLVCCKKRQNKYLWGQFTKNFKDFWHPKECDIHTIKTNNVLSEMYKSTTISGKYKKKQNYFKHIWNKLIIKWILRCLFTKLRILKEAFEIHRPDGQQEVKNPTSNMKISKPSYYSYCRNTIYNCKRPHI